MKLSREFLSSINVIVSLTASWVAGYMTTIHDGMIFWYMMVSSLCFLWMIFGTIIIYNK